MKKFFSYFLAFIFIVPLTFTLAGCKNEPTMNLNYFCEQLQEKGLEKVFCVSANLDYDEQAYNVDGIKQSEVNNSTLNIDNIFASISSKEIALKIPNIASMRFFNNQEIIMQKGRNTTCNYYDKNYEQLCVFNVYKSIDKGEMYSSIFNFTSKLKDATIVFKNDETGMYVVNLAINLDNILNNIYSAILANRNQPLSALIDSVLDCIFLEKSDIVSFVNNFKDTFSDDTTIGDFINYVCNKTGLNFDTLFQNLVHYINISNNFNIFDDSGSPQDDPSIYDIENDMLNYVFYQLLPNKQKIETVKNGYLNYDSLKQTKISDLIAPSDLQPNQTKKDFIFGQLNTILTSSEYTLDALNSTNGIYNSNYESFIGLISNISHITFKLKAELVFQNNFKRSKINVEFVQDTKVYTDRHFNKAKETSTNVNFSSSFYNHDMDHDANIVHLDSPNGDTPTNYNSTIYIALDSINADLTTENFGITLADLYIPLYSFSIKGSLTGQTGAPTETLLSFNKDTQNLVFNTNIINDAISKNYDSILFRSSLEGNSIEVVLILQ